MKHARTLFSFVIVLAFTLTVNAQTASLPLGNPSDATDDVSNKDNFLMVKPQYVLSFNNEKGGPNWVTWHLQSSDIGTEARGDFRPDNSLPAGFKKLSSNDCCVYVQPARHSGQWPVLFISTDTNSRVFRCGIKTAL